jgi:hypothetical protein
VNDEELVKLIERIHQELEELECISQRVNEGWKRARRANEIITWTA